MRGVVTRAVAAAGAVGLVAMVSTVGALAGSQTVKYYVPAGDAASQAFDNGGKCNAAGVADACVDVNGGPIDISASDTSGQPTPLRLFFYDSGGASLSGDAVLVCGSGHTDTPDGTAKVEIRVGVLGRGTITVGDTNPPAMACGKPSPATFGTITVSGPGVGGSSAAAAATGHTVVSHWVAGAPAAKSLRSSAVRHAGRAPVEL